MKLNYRHFYVFLIPLLIHCSDSNNITIVPLEVLNQIDTLNGRTYKFDFFLVNGYVDNKRSRMVIDSFVVKHKGDYPLKFDQYDMTFYKYSEETNVKNIIANPRVIDRYSQQHDLIYGYSWINGKLVSRMKWKNGEVVDPKGTITVEDIPK